MESQKLYPLSLWQNLILVQRKYGLRKQVSNIATSVFANVPLDLGALRKAVDEAIGRNDSFGIRITKKFKEVQQYYTDRKASLVETVDFTGKTTAQMESFFAKVARKPMGLYDQPLAKIYLVKAPDGTCGIFTCVFHIMMDTWAINMFYKDVFLIYLAHTTGSPMPEPPRDFEPLLVKHLEYRSSPRWQEDHEFWQQEIDSVFATPPTYTHPAGLGLLESYRKLIRKPDYPFGRFLFFRTAARHEVINVAKDDVDAMQRFCAEHKVSMHTLLYFGLRTYLARVCGGVDDVTLLDIMANRATLAEKQSGGNRASSLVLRTTLDPGTTFTDALRLVGDRMSKWFRHADYGTMDILGMIAKRYAVKPYEGWFSAQFTFQPMPMSMDDKLRVRPKWYTNGVEAMSLYLFIMEGEEPGSLQCYYQYMVSQLTPAMIQTCHKYIMSVIKAGISNPSITMKELLDLPL